MPTMRCEFSMDQFDKVLQKLAHSLPKFSKVSTKDVTINFHYDHMGKLRRVSVQSHKGGHWQNYWGFSTEPKAYVTSHHVTKITHGDLEDRIKIEAFLKEIMRCEKPFQRFSLSKYAKA